MKKINTLFLSLILLIVFTLSLKAQDNELEETLSSLSSAAAQSYVAPVVSGFGSNLNSGWFALPPEPVKFGFTARLRVVGNGTFFSSDDETFASTGTFRYTSAQADEVLAASGITPGDPNYQAIKNEFLSTDWTVGFSGPTIIGSEDEYLQVEFGGATIQGEEIEPYTATIEEVNGFLNDLSILPSANLQLTLGTVMGTNVAFRWFPEIDIQDLGKFTFFGVGFSHNINVWFERPLPVDITLGYFYQKLDVGDVFESNASQYGAYFSKTFGKGISVTPYAGLTLETSESTVKYDYEFDTPAGRQTTNISFDLEGENNFGFTIGASFKLAVVNLNIDYKAANTGTITAGLTFGVL